MFNDKSIAVVGSGPGTMRKNLGEVIDNYDLVVRINLACGDIDKSDLGSRTDMRFIGATLTSAHDKEFSKNIGGEDILTTSKNKMYMEGSKDGKITFYHSELPRRAFRWYADLSGEKSFLQVKKPPRSGLVFVLSVLAMSRPREVATFGFSVDLESSNLKFLVGQGALVEYDKQLSQRNHCPPEIEVLILKELALKALIHFGDLGV